MLTPYKWLLEYLDHPVDLNTLLTRMKNTGNAVENVESGLSIKNVVVGEINKIEKHPDADKLVVCQVNVKSETVQIVTGASNVF